MVESPSFPVKTAVCIAVGALVKEVAHPPVYTYIYIYVYTDMYMYLYIYIHIYVYIYRERGLLYIYRSLPNTEREAWVGPSAFTGEGAAFC